VSTVSASTGSGRTTATPVVLPVSKAVLWLVGTAILALAAYYFIGVDQGAVSVFGADLHIHEFTHDARHFLGFPCH
jgi:Probable cobalt transporter subunit (CbtB)